MKILLIGEFSRLHNSLKEGLLVLGNEVLIIGTGDNFKNYPVDLSTKAIYSQSKLGNIVRQLIHRLTKFDIEKVEIATRFYFHLKRCKNYDIVQLINEKPIQTVPFLERYLLNKIIKQNKKLFLLICGIDYEIAKKLLLKNELKYSIMTPYLLDKKLKKEYQYAFDFLTEAHKKTHNLIYKQMKGIIVSDIDYLLAIKNSQRLLKLIPNPINLEKIDVDIFPGAEKIIIFHGINDFNYIKKGNIYFEKAIKIIQQKYPDKIKIITVKSIPYHEYIEIYKTAHIVLDQVFSYDQGYNALEAMAKGKVVFTGAETEFTEYYNITKRVCINALPDVDYLVNELSFLIENPKEIIAIGKRARAFIEKEHDYIKIAQQYLNVWSSTT